MTNFCVKCGARLKSKHKGKKLCGKCKAKHHLTCNLNDAEYELFLEYYDIFGCDSVSECVKDLVLEGVKR